MDPGNPRHDPSFAATILDSARQLDRAPAARLAASLWAWAVSGFVMATDEQRASRLEICHGCANWDESNNKCRICGCYLSAKIAMKTSKCPIGLW
jgi:hypothetical protein